MGTNYYCIEDQPCGCCGHVPDPIHIGKSSAGWTFSFHATESLTSWRAWKEYLKDKTIENEYDEEISLECFTKIVENKQKTERFNHTKYCKLKHPSVDCFLDPEGYSFSRGEFC